MGIKKIAHRKLILAQIKSDKEEIAKEGFGKNKQGYKQGYEVNINNNDVEGDGLGNRIKIDRNVFGKTAYGDAEPDDNSSVSSEQHGYTTVGWTSAGFGGNMVNYNGGDMANYNSGGDMVNITHFNQTV